MNRYYFMGFIVVDGCNPNGDPSTGNRPRQTYDGYGEISSVSIKRKIRDALFFAGNDIFVRDEITGDEFLSQRQRAGLIKAKTVDDFVLMACDRWTDVRIFGQVFHLPQKLKERDGSDVASIGIRGPATISQARSVSQIDTETQIVAQAEDIIEPKSGKAKSPMSLAPKFLVWRSAYTFFGGISPQLASLTGMDDDDAEKFKKAITEMFDNGASASRPDGSICLHRLLWWKLSGSASPAKIMRSVHVDKAKEWPYYSVTVDPLENTELEEYVL